MIGHFENWSPKSHHPDHRHSAFCIGCRMHMFCCAVGAGSGCACRVRYLITQKETEGLCIFYIFSPLRVKVRSVNRVVE